MKVTNKSRKIIAINGEPLLPGTDMELPESFQDHPSIIDYLKKGILVDSEKAAASSAGNGISDFERAKIAEEAVSRYKEEQAAIAADEAEKEAEIKAVQSMKKPELLTKAAGMGLEVKDDDTVEILKEKILAALDK